MFLRIVTFFLIVGIASAATWMSKLPPTPLELAHKKGCFVEEINDVIPFGSTLTPLGRCYRIECGRHNIYYASCGVVSAEEPCYVTEKDLTRPYPDCCPDIKCPEQESLTHDTIFSASFEDNRIDD